MWEFVCIILNGVIKQISRENFVGNISIIQQNKIRIFRSILNPFNSAFLRSRFGGAIWIHCCLDISSSFGSCTANWIRFGQVGICSYLVI